MRFGKRGRREPPAAGEPAGHGIAEDDLARADRLLLESVDRTLRVAARRAAHWLACRLGCTECCIGPFPINRLDAWRLRRGLRLLRERDPERAAAVAARARRTVEALRADFPGDAAGGRLSGDAREEDRFFERHAAVPCPVLDPATGGCDLYEHRPISCRTYGPPVVFGGERLAPCRLCFQGAPAGVIEQCRVEPEPDGIEAAILGRLEKAGGGSWETIIAWAIALAADPGEGTPGGTPREPGGPG